LPAQLFDDAGEGLLRGKVVIRWGHG